VISIPLRLPSSPNLREHWAVKARRVKAERRAVAWLLGNGPRPPLPLVVTLTRVSPRCIRDGDNLQGAFKSCRDEVAKWFGVDDADPRVAWRYDQRRGAPKRHVVEITFGPLETP